MRCGVKYAKNNKNKTSFLTIMVDISNKLSSIIQTFRMHLIKLLPVTILLTLYKKIPILALLKTIP